MLNFDYVSDVCEVSRDCLLCPLSHCRFDNPDWYKRGLTAARYSLMAETAKRTRSRDAAAEAHGVTTRTIYRAERWNKNRRLRREYSQQDLNAFKTIARTQTQLSRRCLDCRASIGDRGTNAKRCLACAGKAKSVQQKSAYERRRLEQSEPSSPHGHIGYPGICTSPGCKTILAKHLAAERTGEA